MTIDEAIITLGVAEENLSCDDCLYYNQMEDCPNGEDCIIATAFHMAIASLEAWKKVKAEIGKLSLSWEYGQGVEDCLTIVDHYMQEVTE